MLLQFIVCVVILIDSLVSVILKNGINVQLIGQICELFAKKLLMNVTVYDRVLIARHLKIGRTEYDVTGGLDMSCINCHCFDMF